MKKSVLLVLSTGMIALGAASFTSTAWASTDSTCHLFTYPTFTTGNQVHADGGRTGCTNRVNVAIAVYKEKNFLPDTRIASSYDTDVLGIHRRPGGNCDGRVPYYTTVNSSAGSSDEGTHDVRC